ncbi:MAG TPA: hypothetical protein VJM11_00675, partial [Nevskiaceae bacterium]|nr:hypothetical protein [Nevskiaceae bacterium]
MNFTRIKSGAALASAFAVVAAAAATDAPPLVATSLKGEVIRHAASVQTTVTERGAIEPGQLVETRARSGVQLDFRGAIDITLGPGAALTYHSAEGQQLRVKLGAGDFEALVTRDADLRFNVGPLRAR